ncbi:6576_t:CDS:2, partial [Racocetra persica]
MSFLKKLIIKGNKRKTIIVYDEPDNFWGWDDSQSTCLFVDNEKTFESALLTNEEENQDIIEDYIETSEYKIFTSYKKFKDYLLKEKIISSGYTDNSNNQRLK